MLKTHTLPSGTKMGIEIASWGVVGILRRALAKEMKAVDIQLSDSVLGAALSKDPRAIMAALGGSDVNGLKNIVMQLLGSQEVEEAVFMCMVKCTLQPEGEAVQKITAATFEPEARREDFIPAAVEVIRQNLTPFIKSLNFGLKVSKLEPPGTAPG